MLDFRQPIFHADDFRLEDEAEFFRLRVIFPIAEVRRIAEMVFEERSGNPRGPGEKLPQARTLETLAGVRCHHSNGRKGNDNAVIARLSVHDIKPLVSNFSRTLRPCQPPR